MSKIAFSIAVSSDTCGLKFSALKLVKSLVDDVRWVRMGPYIHMGYDGIIHHVLSFASLRAKMKESR